MCSVAAHCHKWLIILDCCCQIYQLDPLPRTVWWFMHIDIVQLLLTLPQFECASVVGAKVIITRWGVITSTRNWSTHIIMRSGQDKLIIMFCDVLTSWPHTRDSLALHGDLILEGCVVRPWVAVWLKFNRKCAYSFSIRINCYNFFKQEKIVPYFWVFEVLGFFFEMIMC